MALIAAACSGNGEANGGQDTVAALGSQASGTASTADSLRLTFSSISAGRQFTCALDANGMAWCWGANRYGQLGVGDTLDRFVPTAVQHDIPFTKIVAGSTHTCAVDTLASLHCWGDNRERALADTIVRIRTVPAPVDIRGVRQLALGAQFTCITDSSDVAYCWGSDRHGETGDGNGLDMPHMDPRPVSGEHRFIRLAAGRQHACGLTARGAAFCWGDGGALGDGTVADRAAPVEVLGNRRFAEISAGESVTCGIKEDATAWCWGIAFEGQLGHGLPPRPNTFIPGQVAGAVQFAAVSAGSHRVCALDTNGAAWCWGSNYNGGLGDGSGASKDAPVRTAGNQTFVAIAAGDFHTCAIDTAGAAWCWGENADARGGGALGDGTLRSRPTPTLVAPGSRS